MIKARFLRLAGMIAAATCVAGPALAQTTYTVVISQFAFIPDTLEVSVGDTIVWVNEDIVPHTATAADWDSGRMNGGESWSLEVRAPGSIDYACRFHPTMQARLTAN